jgi:hypothetical protein
MYYDGLNILGAATRLLYAQGYQKTIKDVAAVQFGGTPLVTLRNTPAQFLLTFWGHQDPSGGDANLYQEFSGSVIVRGDGKINRHRCITTMDDYRGRVMKIKGGWIVTFQF